MIDKNIKLTGMLDKIELLSKRGEVNVIDYKTGKVRSRNYILGKTKDSNGNYKRQLVFYKLLLDLYDNKRFRMKSGIIDFVEPDERGRYRKEVFDISLQEVKDLKKLIIEKAAEILNLSFWNFRCDDKKCEYCRLREMLG